jgi:hypothetical protein
MRQRAVLVRLADDQPLDHAWTPMIEPVELAEGNELLTATGSPFRWRWLRAIPSRSTHAADL